MKESEEPDLVAVFIECGALVNSGLATSSLVPREQRGY